MFGTALTHNAPPDHKFRVFISGQKRRVTPKIKRELRRGSAVEPVIGHLEHRMGRNYLMASRGRRRQCRPPRRRLHFRRLIRWLALAVPDPRHAQIPLQLVTAEIILLHGRWHHALTGLVHGTNYDQ